MQSRFIKKVATLFLTAISLNLLIFSTQSFASDLPEEIGKMASEKPCIDLTKDGDKIVTIIEEALPIDTKKTDDYEIKTCYRHTLEGPDGGVTPALTTEKCKTEYLPGKDGYKYACYEVQVILSSGGTALIYTYIGMVYEFGATMAGIVAVLIIVLSGIQISASGGDSEAIENAKKRILKSFAGIAVLFLSGLILYTINPTFFTNG